jgi:hypothetical protein
MSTGEHNLFLKAKKCEFCKTKIEYLGMIIEQGKIAMDSVKLGGIRDWPTPVMCSIIPWIWKLLSKIHLPLLRPCSAPKLPYEEKQKV